MTSKHSTFVHFGGCWTGDHDETLDCAVDRTKCPKTPTDHSKAPVNNFHPVDMLAQTEWGGSDKHDECTAEGVKNAAVACGGSGLCQVTDGVGNDTSGGEGGEACPGASTTEGCSLLSNIAADDSGSNNSDILATVYGACQDAATQEIACAWSAESCSDGEIYLSPAELFQVLVVGKVNTDRLYCSCEQVRVGACQASAAYGRFCSVQASSCGPESIFVSVKDLDGDDSCRLCDAMPDDVRISTDFYFAQRKSELLDALARGEGKNQVLLADSHPSNNQPKPSGDLGKGSVSVIAVVGLLLGLFGAAIMVRGRRRRQAATAVATMEAIHRDDDLFLSTGDSDRYTDEQDVMEQEIPATNRTLD